MRTPAIAVLALLAPALALAALPAGAEPCPAGAPSGLVQSDAGSGRDAGDVREGAVPVAQGLHWGVLDPPAHVGALDLRDWFAAEVPPGPRTVSVEVKSLGKVLAPDASWPLVYWMETWRGDTPLGLLGSWEPPLQLASPGGEVLHLEVYLSPLVWEEACAQAAAAQGAGALPPELQAYRVRFACAPSCG